MSRPLELPTLTPTIALQVMDTAMHQQQPQQASPQAVDAAIEAGRAEGYAAGAAAAQAELASAIAAMQQAAAELQARRDQWVADLEPAAVQLILAGAEQVVGVALEINPDLIEPTVRVALRRLVDRDSVMVLVNPDDYQRVQEMATDAANALGGIERLDVQTEARVSPGGVMVQTAEGDVDATIETRLARFEEVLRDALAT